MSTVCSYSGEYTSLSRLKHGFDSHTDRQFLASRSVVDQVTVNHSVVGSIPTSPASLGDMQKQNNLPSTVIIRMCDGLSVWVAHSIYEVEQNRSCCVGA